LKITKDMSDLINLMIIKLTSTDYDITSRLIDFRAFNGSFVPFIGPNWIDVDFSADQCFIAYIELESKGNVRKYIGFNENLNFDHYPYFIITGNDWNSIKTIFANIYIELNSVSPKYGKISNWFREINDLLINFSSKLEIIRD